MKKEEILSRLREIKPKLKKDGFLILGVTGSYAKDEKKSSSDIDILYKIENIKEYLQKNSGWESINKIVETKEFLTKSFGKNVDFIDRDLLNPIGEKYILKDLLNV